MDNGIFNISPTKLRKQLNITQYNLNKIVKDNSQSVLFLDKCAECSKPIKINITAQSRAKKIIENNNFQCDICKKKFNDNYSHLDYKEKNIQRIEYAFTYKYWERLKPFELEILKTILNSDNLDYMYNPKFTLTIEKLNRIKLIDIQKDIDDRFTDIYYSPKLKSLLLQKEKREKEKSEKLSKKHLLEFALKNEFWNKLTTYEFDILKSIIRMNNYSEIYTKLYKEKSDFKKNWPIIDKLNRLGLIEIKRNNLTNKITEFYFLQELRKVLEINTNFKNERVNSLSFNVPEKFNRTKETQPHFARKIIFENSIILKPDVEYICSIWQNLNGTIDFKLTETTEIKNNQKEHQKINKSEPIKIGDIIKKITGI